MGSFIRTTIKKCIIVAAFSMLFSCGDGKEKVETVRGPKGEKGDIGQQGAKGETGQSGQNGQNGQKGDRGDIGQKGDRGDTGQQGTPAPLPLPIPVPPIPQPPVIVYPPYPSDPGNYCSGCIIVCACLNGSWQSIIINVHDRYRYNIKNDGVCF